MPAKQPTPLALPTDEQLFAAIDRAERHLRGERGASLATVKQHLALPRSGWSTLKMRPQLDRLLDAGEIERFKRLGMIVWTVTDKGRRRLSAAQKAGRIELPESPQHRQWREARAFAAEHAGEFGERLRQVLADATGLLDAHEPANSDTWKALTRRLERACRRMESASYCLHEWQEPDDSKPDTVPDAKTGLRSIKTLAND